MRQSLLDVAAPGKTRELIKNMPRFWTLEDRFGVSYRIRNAVLVLTMIRQLATESTFFLLPNELLFHIFYFL